MGNKNDGGHLLKAKDFFETLQAIATVIAIIAGGWWTYTNFIEGREDYPHLKIKHNISHLVLSDHINVVSVKTELENIGKRKVTVKKLNLWIEQVLPLVPCDKDKPCASKEINEAMKKHEREQDFYTWPLIAERNNLYKQPWNIEPGEKETLDFEFAISSAVEVIQAYTFVRNENQSDDKDEVGWQTSNYYDFKREIKGKSQ